MRSMRAGPGRRCSSARTRGWARRASRRSSSLSRGAAGIPRTRRPSSTSAPRRGATRSTRCSRASLAIAPEATDAQRRAGLDRAVADGRVAADDAPFAADLLAVAQRAPATYEAMDDAARREGRLRTLVHAIALDGSGTRGGAAGRGRALGHALGAGVRPRARRRCAARRMLLVLHVAARGRSVRRRAARHRGRALGPAAARCPRCAGARELVPEREPGRRVALRRARAGQPAVPDAAAAQRRGRRRDPRLDPERRAGPAGPASRGGQGRRPGGGRRRPALRSRHCCGTCSPTPPTTPARCSAAISCAPTPPTRVASRSRTR